MQKVLVTLLNEGFVTGYIGFIKSLLYYNPRFNFPFYILDDGLSDFSKKQITVHYSNVKFLHIPKEDYKKINLSKTRERLRSTYYKLETFRLGKKGVSYAVFIDMDILVRDNILELFNPSILKGSMFGACRAYMAGTDTLSNEVNSGVFAVDFTKLPSNAFDNMLKIATQGRAMPDQEVINYYFVSRKKHTYLSKRYNVEKRMMKSTKYPDYIDGSAMLHFVNIKPWEKVDREQEFKPLYDKWWAFRIISIRKAHNAKSGLQDFIDRCKQFAKIPLKVVVEVGSYVGDSTRIFADNFEQVIAIDPWKNFYDEKDQSSYKFPMSVIEGQFEELVAEKGNIIKIKTTSLEGAKQFSNDSIDMVYIDAVHRYKEVVEDLHAWYPKVKHGGIVAGHDFQGKFPGCMQAINEYIGNPQLLGKDTSWGIIKGHHPTKIHYTSYKNTVDIESSFTEFMRDKRVCFIGPSPVLKGLGRGEEFDEYDVVVRSNNMVNLLEKPSVNWDFGTKCDVLYVNVHFERDCNEAWNIATWERLGLKYICKASRMPKKYHTKEITQRYLNYTLAFEPPTPLLGVVSIAELLSLPIKSLYITGIDGYINAPTAYSPEEYPEYIADYLPKQAKEYRDTKLVGKCAGHDHQRDAQKVLDLAEEYKEICVIDPVCKPLLETVARGGRDE